MSPSYDEAMAEFGATAPSPVQHEHGLQKAAIRFLRQLFPGAIVWSIDCGWPGGTERDERIRRARWQRGVPGGLPDIWLIRGAPAPLIVFETKGAGGLSDAQLDRRHELITAGHQWFGPITTLGQIEACLLSLGMKLSATCGGPPEAVPKIGARRLANWARLHDAVPDMRCESSRSLLE